MKLPEGFLLSGLACGIKKRKPDLGLIYVCGPELSAAGFFTTNANPSYSVTLSKKHIHNPIRAVLVNSGNANCHSHKEGLKDTREIVGRLAGHLRVKKENILIASTGIIGKKLPKQKIIRSIPALVNSLTTDADDFAKSILTTDTFAKKTSVSLRFKGRSAVIAGFAKGAGMIYPHMATMLAFVLTDVALSRASFRSMAREAIEESFNAISVDGCMSTNDTVLVLSSGKVQLAGKLQVEAFRAGLKKVCLGLAQMIVRDAEGATKFITITVQGARDQAEAKKAAESLANSNLLKCALYGARANWGRIIAALGQAGVAVEEDIRVQATDLKRADVALNVDLRRGKSSWRVYTCDLTPEYIKINASYS